MILYGVGAFDYFQTLVIKVRLEVDAKSISTGGKGSLFDETQLVATSGVISLHLHFISTEQTNR